MNYEETIDQCICDMVSEAQKIPMELSRAVGELENLFKKEEVNLLGTLEVLKNVESFLEKAKSRIYRISFLDDCVSILLKRSQDMHRYNEIRKPLLDYLFDIRGCLAEWRDSIHGLTDVLLVKGHLTEKDLNTDVSFFIGVIEETKEMLKLMETIQRL